MTGLVRVLDKSDVDQARADARKDFIARCLHTYGYIPFSDEYLDRSWPPESEHYG